MAFDWPRSARAIEPWGVRLLALHSAAVGVALAFAPEWSSQFGGFGPLLVGSPATVADELQSWVEETDVDGFNLAYAVTHETFADVVDLLVPELQRRGVYKRAYQPGTLREKLGSAGPRLPAEHPAAGYRDLARQREESAIRVPA